jgi:hypothetical protein
MQNPYSKQPQLSKRPPYLLGPEFLYQPLHNHGLQLYAHQPIQNLHELQVNN